MKFFIKTLLLSILIAGFTVEAPACLDESFVEAEISKWIPFPATYGYIEDGVSKEETVEVLFPAEPKYIEERDYQSPVFVAYDEEGISYALTNMLIPQDFQFSDSVQFLAESIKKSTRKKLLAAEDHQSTDRFSLVWIEGDSMTRIDIYKSAHFVYFLETHIRHEIYQNFESLQENPESLQIVMQHLIKSEVFAKSFAIKQ